MLCTGVELNNWMRFRGKHSINLRQQIYGITARWVGNPRRSNWSGKTAFLEGMLIFLLYGEHRWRVEDAWITRGEKSGGVSGTFGHDGYETVVERTRKLGGPTALVVKTRTICDGVSDWTERKGDEAQLYLERITGLNYKDFIASGYFRQKQMARFITDEAGIRMATIAGWLKLGPLEEACSTVGADLTKLQDQIAIIESTRRSGRETIRGVMEREGFDQPADLADPVATFDVELKLIEDELVAARKDVFLKTSARDAILVSKRVFAEAREHAALIIEGKELRSKIDGYFKDVASDEDRKAAADRYEAIVSELALLAGEVEKWRALAQGKFDGHCPVGGGDCPIKLQINANIDQSALSLEKAVKAFNVKSREKHEASEELDLIDKRRERLQDDLAARKRLVERVKKLAPSAERCAGQEEQDPTEANALVEEAGKNLHTVEQDRYGLRAARDLVVAQLKVSQSSEDDLQRLRSQAELLREAQVILGRQGAQRRLAEDALQEIERGANEALAICSIDLSMEVRWARETKGLAKACDACGAPFPSSAKVKVCARCGVERGPQLEHKLDIVVSDVSGAAEDLAGCMFQLSGAAWLRRDRMAALAIAALDEPFGALDTEHREALASHLPQLLKHFGFVQAFCIAHSAGIMGGMPALIEIEAGPQGSRILGGQDGLLIQREAENRDGRDTGKLRQGAGRGARPPRGRSDHAERLAGNGGTSRNEQAHDRRVGPDGRGGRNARDPASRAPAKARAKGRGPGKS